MGKRISQTISPKYERATLKPLQNQITWIWLNSTWEKTWCAGLILNFTNQFKPMLSIFDYPQNYLEAQCQHRKRCTGSLQCYVIKSKHWSFDCRSQNLCEIELHWTINSIANSLIILRLKHVALHTQSYILWPLAESIHYKSSHASVAAITISYLLNATQNETCFRWFRFSPPDLNQINDVLQKLNLCNS